MSNHVGSSPSRNRSWILVAIILVALFATIIAWLVLQRPPRARNTASLTAKQRIQLEELKNQTIGLLENGKYVEADQKLIEIIDAQPDDILGIRDLAINRILAQESGQGSIEQLRSAVETLLEKDGNSAVSHLIAGAAEKLGGDLPAAMSAFKRAQELSPDDPAIAYEIAQLGRETTDESIRNDARAALMRASDLLPKNLFLLMEKLVTQVETRDPQLVRTLQGAQDQLLWLADSIRMQSRVELKTLLSTAEEAAKEGKWPVATANVRILANVLRPQPAVLSDRQRIQKHPLEYVVRDFSSKLDSLQTSPSVSTTTSIDVTFQSIQIVDNTATREQVTAMELSDVDLDGQLDLVIYQSNQLRIFGRSPADGRWELQSISNLAPGLSGIVVADLDQDLEEGQQATKQRDGKSGLQPVCHDADPDFLLFGQSGVALLRNELDKTSGKRVTQLVPQASPFADLRDVLAVTTTDLDHDGDLDLAVSSRNGISLWSNRGDMTFMDLSGNSQLPPADLGATALLAVDLDRDLDFDLLCGSPTQPSGYLENVGHGRFRWQAFPDDRAALIRPQSLAVLANNSRATWQIIFAGPQGTAVLPTRIPKPGHVEFERFNALSSQPMAGLLKWDYDNDGFFDLVSWSSAELRLHRGKVDQQFQDVSSLVADLRRPNGITSCKAADYDNDGDLDLFLAGVDGVTIFTNQGGNQNHWLNVSLRAEQEKGGQLSASGRVNHYGIGSMLELRSGLNYQAQIVEGPVSHFGLGTRQADIVRVLWTNGVPDNIINPEFDQQLCEKQTLKGSCPYLYTWTGTDFEFWTDLLWNAPMGLQFAEGVYAPPRSSEYLKIAGNKLVEKDGLYRLQITEELWEAAYFDQVRLMAVDHPHTMEIYSNEKVGPADIAAFKVHTVQKPIAPIAARDQLGRDVLELVSRTDGKFVKAFDRKLRQGLAEEHFLELDFGSIKDDQQLTLFLTGWIYPTDTSINVALGQRTDLKGPRPPSLWVPTTNGGWREARPFMGFPGGKTKTIAIDLSGLFETDDRRVRIVTSAEIYWDSAFVTANEPPGEYQLETLPLVSADLHYRGFSRRVPHLQNGPETLDYQHVGVDPLWPPMDGRFTRYGDITKLLEEEDDLLVVLGSGDEMTLTFAAPKQAVRSGYTRDFLIYNVGWDKDADMNTVYGQSVEPLPFKMMSGYPYRGEEAYPETPQHIDYLRQYQTRRQSTNPFWQR